MGPHDMPKFDLSLTEVRLGVTLEGCRHDSGLLCGVPEIAIAMQAAPVIDGFGHIVVGPALLLRYTFGDADCRLLPYVQAGAGIVYTDASHDHTQHAIGQEQEFTLQAAVGLHYMISACCSLDAEGQYLHISNADLAHRNAGVNGLGAAIGITFHFGKCR
jgi:outer membrane protein W